MKRSILLVGANLRKAKGQSVAIFILILLCACMLNIWLILSMDYKQNLERSHEEMNGEHVTLVVSRNDEAMKEQLISLLEEDARTADYTLSPIMEMVGQFQYNGGKVNAPLLFIDMADAMNRRIGQIEIVADSAYDSGIYLPLIYRSEELDIGKEIVLSIGSQEQTYTICGFFNSMMYGSHNCGMIAMVLTSDQYEKLAALGYAPGALLGSIRLLKADQGEDYATQLKTSVVRFDSTVRITGNHYAMVAQSRFISQMICAGVMSAMACFILVIALVVIIANIINYIQEHMKQLGTLKALGYTSAQLIQVLLLQFEGLCVVASLFGIALAYGVFPIFNEMMIAQTGIPYHIHFVWQPFLFTMLILGSAVALVVWYSARRIRHIAVITALRQGVTTHSFKRNYVSLAHTNVPLSFALALKTALTHRKYQVTVCITMMVLALVVVFSGLMLHNMILDQEPFLNLIVGESADSCININLSHEEALRNFLERDERVNKYYLYHSESISHVGGVDLVATLSDDFNDVNNRSVVFEGRYPRYDNEVAIAAKYANDQDLRIGDEITLALGDRKERYLITGLIQITNNLGKDCLMTRSGFERLRPLQNTSYYVNLDENVEIDAFHEEISGYFGREVNALINIRTTIASASSVYVMLMSGIVIAILVLSVLIITFVLYLLVKTLLNNKVQEYGVYKALGYTTRQLILQTALSFMPSVVLSLGLGLLVNAWLINPLVTIFLSGIGIVKCTFIVPHMFNCIAGLVIVLFTFCLICLMARRIKRITPKQLLVGE
ncbi:MAG: ABC transporter permease [Erysipelotrichaceae bacterium]|nr:ABC transporter permease [Erysipelotrichaceae bacterium]